MEKTPTSCCPFVIKGQIKEWGASQWTPNYLADQLKDVKLYCKIAYDKGLWETECIKEKITLQQFVDWNAGISRGDNPLDNYLKDGVSCYIDYKYMAEILFNRPDLLQEVDWSKFGFEGRKGEDSTIWIGGEECYTNCHYDTYGFNLVAQIYGRKRWILFPPSDNLYPTRIPYEESSVFSEVNVLSPDLDRHPAFKDSHPHVIDLVPGDVLFVPRHWWHYVECMDTAISINTWIPMEEDTDSYMTESLTRLLLCSMQQSVQFDSDWINPAEELDEDFVNFSYVQAAFSKMRSKKPSVCSNLKRFMNAIKNLAEPNNSLAKEENISSTETDPANVQISDKKIEKRKQEENIEETEMKKIKISEISPEGKSDHKKFEVSDISTDKESDYRKLNVSDISQEEKLDHGKLKVSDASPENIHIEAYKGSESCAVVQLIRPMSFDEYQREIIHSKRKSKYVCDDSYPQLQTESVTLKKDEKICDANNSTDLTCDTNNSTDVTFDTKNSTDVTFDAKNSTDVTCDTNKSTNVRLEPVDCSDRRSDELTDIKSSDMSELKTSEGNLSSKEPNKLSFKCFVKTLLHPEVIEKIKDVLTLHYKDFS